MTQILMNFLPMELVNKIEKTTHQMCWEDVMFQNQRRYWQKQHKEERKELFGDPRGGDWEDTINEEAYALWENAGKSDDEINLFDWGLNSTRDAFIKWSGQRWEEVDVGTEGGMWNKHWSRDEYILQEPHPEIIKVDCGLCCGCKWGRKCLR